MSAWTWIGIALLGGTGATGRFLLDGLVSRRSRRDFPRGTLAVNASGALVLGLLDGLAVTGTLLLLAGTALVGSYTTFSTWMFETHRLAEDAAASRAAANIAISLLVGVAAAAAGHALGASV